jgi:hypothetical protein
VRCQPAILAAEAQPLVLISEAVRAFQGAEKADATVRDLYGYVANFCFRITCRPENSCTERIWSFAAVAFGLE